MKKVSILIGAIAVLFLYGTAYADVWYVHPDSTLNSIQAGIDLCSTGDTVLVGAGTYVENTNFNGKAITVKSEHGPDTTTIDGGSPVHLDSGSVVLFKSGEGNSSVLDGFTLTGGTGTNTNWGYLGGGICCFNQSSPTIINNIINENAADVAGGGIDCDVNCNAVISHNTITMNTAEIGGGIEFYTAMPTITENIIEYNTAASGGGVSISDYGSGIISHNTIRHNTATVWGRGGGIAVAGYTTALIEHNLIANNIYDGIYMGWPTNPTIIYNDIIDNEGYGICNIEASVTIDADSNWWGDATGPYHPTANPGGLGDTVSDYVDFDPWLTGPGVNEKPITKPIDKYDNLGATIFTGPLLLPEGKKCRIFDIIGRVVAPDKMRPGIYFIEIDNMIVRKVIKIR